MMYLTTGIGQGDGGGGASCRISAPFLEWEVTVSASSLHVRAEKSFTEHLDL